MLLICLVPVLASGQVNICYNFDDSPGNSRPAGWGALPNLDFNHVGVLAYDNTSASGAHALHVKGNVCYALMPDEGIDYAGDGVWLSFRYYLSMNTTRIEVGYLTDATDTSTFHLLSTAHWWGEWFYNAVVDLSSVPVGARVAFRSRDIMADDGTFWIDDVFLTSEPCDVEFTSLRVTGNWADSVRVEWKAAGNPDVTIGSGSNTYSPVGNSITVPRFFPETSYASSYYHLSFYDLCDSVQDQSPCRHQGMSTYFDIPPYREGPCIAVTDSYSSMALPYVGTPVEPYLELGPRSTNRPGVTGIYRGSHTVTTNPNAETGSGQMIFPRIIPPGDDAVLRLGNRLGDWESASMLYTITVDTAVSDLLVVKYTVAMNDGIWLDIGGGPEMEHADSVHPPHFCIELLDDTLGSLPDGCNRVELNGMSVDGWDVLDERNNSYSRRNLTGKFFDLRPYHGQRIRLRITVTDGALNNRWCYAYYNTECLKQSDVVGGCEVDSITLAAPFGFSYRWWRDGHPSTDTVQSITVPTDGALWHCTIADRHDPACTRTIHRRAIGGPLVEVRDTVVENQLPYTFRGFTFRAATDTTIFLPAATGCDTMLRYHLHVWNNRSTRLVRSYCPDAWPITLGGHTFTGPDSVITTYTDIHGADSTVTIVAVELPEYEVWDTTVFCPGSPFVWGDIDFGGPAAFDTVLSTAQGCDSLVHVALVLRDSSVVPRIWHSVDGWQWADTVPIVLCSNQRLSVVDSTLGAQAWLWSLDGGDSATGRQAEFNSVATDTIVCEWLTLVVTAYGCDDSLSVPVYVVPAPTAAFAWNPETPCDLAPEVQMINYSRPDSCLWQWLVTRSDGGTDTLAEREPVYRWEGDLPNGDFDVTLIASITAYQPPLLSPHTCADTARHTVTVATSLLRFPNLVTPNGDGVNDRWEVVNLVELGQYPMNELWIYNGWGVLVFHARNIRRRDEFWDPDSPRMPDGTYFFRFQARGEHGIVRHNGTIEVLR